jgi:D-beta-D-heptose 7-phosphate kinase / D-beta-D-heptose 1-phosphate adenosyltransferase
MTWQSQGLAGALKQIAKAKIAIIGDVMIDEYLTGDVSRISPEAPVLIVRGQHRRHVPGGAANVAANVVAMGAQAYLVGVAGDDGGADLLMATLEAFGGTCRNGLVCESGRKTTRKTRILAQQQQIVRLDDEDVHPIVEPTRTELVARGLEAITWADGVVLSDYGKGALDIMTLRELIDGARTLGKLIIVDPKRSDLRAYSGASILTPNRGELAKATGLPLDTEEQIAEAATIARQMFGGDLLLTRSEKGMSYFGYDRAAHVPTIAREVFDVSGAGDTVVATLACSLAAGFERIDAVHIANHAAGVVVGKTGTATLTQAELLESLSAGNSAHSEPGELTSWEKAARLRSHWRNRGFTVGLANGCFDIIHPGHISLIRQAAASCDRLIMALNSDMSVRRLKGPNRPVQTERERAEVIGAIRGVDLVVLFDQDTPLELIEFLTPDVLVKGADYTVDRVVGADLVAERGGKVLLVDLVAGQSTTSLLARTR